MVDRINKGQAVEGHYFALTKDVEGLKYAEEKWKTDMQVLAKRCEKVVQECSDQWKVHAQKILDATYDEHYTAANNVLADKLFAALMEGVPQRRWAVWVYDESLGFEQHCITSPAHLMKWHKNDKMVTIVGFDEENSLLNVEEARSAFTKLKTDIMKTCTMRPSMHGMTIVSAYRGGEVAKKMVEFMIPSLTDPKAVYAVRSSKNIAFRAAPSTFFEGEITGHCVSSPMKVFVFK